MRIGFSILAGIACMAMCVATMASAGQFYTWTDETGRERQAFDLDDVPKQYREAAEAGAIPDTGRISVTDTDDEANAAAAVEAMGSATGTADNAQPGGRDEMWWRAAYREKREALEAAKVAVQAARDSGLDVPKGTPAKRGPPTPSAGIGPDVLEAGTQDTESAESRARKNLDAARNEMMTFMTYARSSGVPAGWLH